jgi:transposase-like protein
LDAIESLNMSLRKVSKTRGSFPNDEAVMKLIYLALRNVENRCAYSEAETKAGRESTPSEFYSTVHGFGSKFAG